MEPHDTPALEDYSSEEPPSSNIQSCLLLRNEEIKTENPT